MGCNSSSQQALLLSEIEKLKQENELLQSQLSEAEQKLNQKTETGNQELDKLQSDLSQSQTRIQKLKEKHSVLKSKHSVLEERHSLVVNREIIIETTNSADRLSRLGASGKFYCKGQLNTKCSCCNNTCGPTNGCNCVACMELDVSARCLPNGYLVNKEGRISKLAANGNVYCGSKVMNGVPGCDGWCGPNNGPQCSSCRILQGQWNERYCKITWTQS